MGTTEQITNSISDAKSSVGGAVGAASEAMPSPTDVNEMIARRAQGNPLAAGLIAFAGGLVLASVVRPTQAEQRGAGQFVEHAQPFVTAAQGATQEPKSGIKESLHGVVENVTARSSAAAVGEHAKTATDEVGTRTGDAVARQED